MKVKLDVLADPNEGVQHTILTFWTPSCKNPKHETSLFSASSSSYMNSCSSLWRRRRAAFSTALVGFNTLSFRPVTKRVGSILTRPDRINLTSSESLEGLDGGRRVAVKSSVSLKCCDTLQMRICASERVHVRKLSRICVVSCRTRVFTGGWWKC